VSLTFFPKGRVFLYVKDVVDAKSIGSFVNIWYEKDIFIKELALLIKEITNYDGK